MKTIISTLLICVFVLLEAPNALGQTSLWTPETQNIFNSPWVMAKTNEVRQGQNGMEQVPPFETVDFTNCSAPLMGDENEGGISFGLLAPDREQFATDVPEAKNALGDLHVFNRRRTVLALYENRLFGGAPRAEIWGDVRGVEYPNGANLISATHFRNLKVEDGRVAEISEERPQQTFMVLRAVTEANGKQYFQLITKVAADGSPTNNSRLYYSCQGVSPADPSVD